MRASMTSRIHRGLWRVAISLALGAIVTVLVAWSAPRTFLDPSTKERVARKAWPLEVPVTWPLVPDVVYRHPRTMKTIIGSVYNEFYERKPQHSGSAPIACSMWEVRHGWPVRALARFEAEEFSTAGRVHLDLGLIRLGLTLPDRWSVIRGKIGNRLPLVPLWPGFAINTIFYGTLAFAAMAGATALRRRRRFRRGLCVQCAYPCTGGDLCPECGTAVASAVKPPAPAAEPAGPTPV